MLGEIYIASSLAIFLAIFGWSEQIFGLSDRNTRVILSFCEKTKLSYTKYIQLIDLRSKSKTKHPGKYMSDLMSLLRGSAIQREDKATISILEKNSKLLSNLEKNDKYKKIYFLVLFGFLFAMGTLVLFLEISHIYGPIIFSQLDLILLIIIGGFIYNKSNRIQYQIQENLRELMTRING